MNYYLGLMFPISSQLLQIFRPSNDVIFYVELLQVQLVPHNTRQDYNLLSSLARF